MSAGDTTDAKAVVDDKGTAASKVKETLPMMTPEQYRSEAVQRRRLRSTEIIKARKRKLAELYFITKSPLIPVSDQKLIENETNLTMFLERNDIVKGHKFDQSTLPQPPVTRPPSGSTSTLARKSTTPKSSSSIPQTRMATQQPPQQIPQKGGRKQSFTSTNATPMSKNQSPPLSQKPTPQSSLSPPLASPETSKVPTVTDEIQEPPQKIQKLDTVKVEGQGEVGEQQDGEQESQSQQAEKAVLQQEQQEDSINNRDAPVPQNLENAVTGPQSQPQYQAPIQEVFPIPPTPKDYKPTPTLSSLIQAYAESKPSKMTEKELLEAKRELDVANIDINKLSVLLMPGNLPSQIPESSPLAELYYLTQTCPLSKLIPTTHKTLTTETYESALFEGKLAVVYSRIEELKRQKKWSLRQPQRYQDPFTHYAGHKSHWGHLLEEAKWMATDFKEGRKFKMVQCMFVAQAVSDYWSYGKVMCINRKPIRHLGEEDPQEQNEVQDEHNEGPVSEEMEVDGTTKVVEEDEASDEVKQDEGDEDKAAQAEQEEEEEDEEEEEEQEEEEAEEEEAQVEKADTNQEEAEPASEDHELQEEDEEKEEEEDNSIDVSLLLKRPDPASEIPVPELPTFTKEEIPQSVQPFKMYVDKEELSVLNANIIEALPSYEPFAAEHEVKESPLVPISKLLTPLDEDDHDWYKVVAKENYFFKGSSYATERGLFGFSSTKRLTFIRPPIPPPLRYLELRIPTIWLPEDDRHLIRYVAEFQFNWNIIAAHLSARPSKGYISNIERRTPWQCFERYIQLNDKFQFSDMRGGYTQQAQLWLEAAHRAQSTTKRRISPLGVGNESIQRGHKRLRWASMFEAMRKLMKKRESAPKPNNAHERRDDKKINAPSPADLAKLKYERDKAIQEAYAHQNTNSQMRRSNSQQQPAAAQQQAASSGLVGGVSTGAQATTNAQIQAVQRQLAAAASQAHAGAIAGNAQGPGAIPNASATLVAKQAQVAALQRMQNQQRAAAAAAAVANNGVAGTSGAGSPATAGKQHAQLQASNAALQAQQARLQQQQAALAAAQRRGVAPRSNSNPVGTVTGPNGQPYTAEQLQHLMQLQRQRSLQAAQLQAAQLQSAPASAANSNAGTPTMAGANLVADGSKSMSPGAKTVQPGQTPAKHFSTSFSNSQVTAIVQQIQAQHPHLNKQQVSKLAASYLHNLSSQQQQAQHRGMQQHAAKVMKQSASNPATPLAQPPVQLAEGSQSAQPPARNLESSLQMLNSAQLTKLASSPTLTAAQRAQILSVQQQRLRNAGQAVMANNRVNGGTGTPTPANRVVQQPMARTPSGSIPTPQQLAAQRARLQEQQLLQQQQQQQQQGKSDGSAP